VISDSDFKDYALYFSAWQIISQLIGFQLAFTFFRYGDDAVYKGPIIKIASNISIISFLVSTFTILTLIFTSSLFLACVGMAVVFSLFNMVAEFVRSQREEGYAFICFSIPGVITILFLLMSLFMEEPPSRDFVICVEMISYTIAILAACKIAGIKNNILIRDVASNLIKIIPAWREISLPLIPNNIIWYLYFNLPQLLLYEKISDPELYNNQAITLRLIVVMSTVASTISIIVQKPLIKAHDESFSNYKHIKRNVLNKWLPFLFFINLSVAFLLRRIYESMPINGGELLLYINNNIVWLSIIFWLFFSNYTTAHFFVAEKNTKFAAKSMFFGFIVYVLSGFILFFEKAPLTEIPIHGITIALSTTLLFRYLKVGFNK
jgi:hypothetical protein